MNETSDQQARLHALVGGRVQGVGFRHFVVTTLNRLSLTIAGDVRNLYDGRVEVRAEGSRQDLERLLAVLEEGPRWSSVDDVEAVWLDARNDLNSPFSVLPSGTRPWPDG